MKKTATFKVYQDYTASESANKALSAVRTIIPGFAFNEIDFDEFEISVEDFPVKNYENEANQLLSNVFREEWMSDSDWREVQTALLSENNITIQTIANDISIGVRNGYTPDEQRKITIQYLKDITART